MALLGVVSIRGTRCQPPSLCSVVQALSARSQAVSLSCCDMVPSLRFICKGEIGFHGTVFVECSCNGAYLFGYYYHIFPILFFLHLGFQISLYNAVSIGYSAF